MFFALKINVKRMSISLFRCSRTHQAERVSILYNEINKSEYKHCWTIVYEINI